MDEAEQADEATRSSSVGSFQGVGADVSPFRQHLLGDLLDVGVIVLRGVWREAR